MSDQLVQKKGRDMSREAIMARYDKANMKAICASDRDVFDSLQDIYTLMNFNADGTRRE